MMHKLIQIKNLTLSFPHKTCFENFSVQIPCGSRIAIIGRNGSGKSMLLNLLRGTMEASQGNIIVSKDVVFGYVPQIIEAFEMQSGGQRFHAAFTQVLSIDPLLFRSSSIIELSRLKYCFSQWL